MDANQQQQPTAPTPEQIKEMEKAGEQQMLSWLEQVLGCTVNGAMAMAFNVPRRLVMLCCCRVMGKFAGLTPGDVVDVLKFRSACLKAFADSMNACEIAPMPTAMPPANHRPAPNVTPQRFDDKRVPLQGAGL